MNLLFLDFLVYINDGVLDTALQYLEDNGSRLDICSQEPANYTEATSTYTLGNKTSIGWTGPADRSPNGRKETVNAITDGNVTGTGTASHWGVSKTSATTALLAAGALASSQGVTNGNTFTLTAFDIGIPDAA